MRLYLSSFRLGDQSDVLVELVRRTERRLAVAVIANACDVGERARRAEAVALELVALTGLGLEPFEIDLRDYDATSNALARDLADCGAMWVRGGNVFTLRHAMATSGADTVIPQLIADDALVYAGYSAGGCALAPSLRGLEHCDPTAEVRELYGADPTWDGLGVLDRAFVPHLDSPGHPETVLLGEVAAAYRRDDVPFWGLRDGQVLLVDGDLADAQVL